MSAVHYASETAPLTTMASAMFFGTILFTTVALAVKAMSLGEYRVLKAPLNPRSSALDIKSFASIYSFFFHMSILGLIMFYAYLCEYHPPYPHGPKSYDRDEFFFMTALLILVSLFTLECSDKKKGAAAVSSPQKRKTSLKEDEQQAEDLSSVVLKPSSPQGTAVAPINEDTEILNRDQTEEWKGWMQFMFLLYHYYHAEETYNAIRVMITCYVWMTGFGNFSFFYIKGDYGSVRVLQMLWRLNFLVAFLCLTQGTTYILYYICLLHTYFFLMVYCVMRIGKHLNYTRMGARIKLAILAVIIYVVWDLNSGIFRLVHYPFLGEYPVLGATSGAMWEWYFRSSLDHWSTFLGMTFALNFPTTSLFFRKLEAQPLARHIAAKTAMGIPLLLGFVWWVTGPFMHGKYDYNMTNAYFAWIPLYAYIYFRNLTPWLRSHTLGLLHTIGKTTLETYLMQHHIWLTSDAKSLLILIPGWPKMNFLVVTVIYFILSRKLYALTLYLRGMILPNNRYECIRNLVLLAGSIGAFLGLAALLRALSQLNLFVVMIISVTGGFALYEAIVLRTIDTSGNSSFLAAVPGNIKSAISPLSGAVMILVIGIVWQHMARIGASKIISLPASCADFANQGQWIPVEACAEDAIGTAYRDYGVEFIGTCAPQTTLYAWGWDATEPSSYCRFAHRDPQSLLKVMDSRVVEFVGDSVTRHLYHSTCRQLGDSSAGAYNTTIEKHSDFTNKYKNTDMRFKWAPYTDEVVGRLKDVGKQNPLPDLVVVGGGAWDRLNKYHNETEQKAFRTAAENLASEIKELKKKGVPVVWTNPTTINTWALMTEEKRANIREEDMVPIRKLYADVGVVDASSFVLDGEAFTSSRVAESFDGVHYPLSVYDAGAQILANAFDFLLPKKVIEVNFVAPRPGKMANPILGIMMLCFAFMAVFLFDSFFGASYLASIFVPSVAPMHLYWEAFTSLHEKLGLPPIRSPQQSFSASGSQGSSFEMHDKSKSSDMGGDHEHMSDDELEAFIQGKENEQNLTATI